MDKIIDATFDWLALTVSQLAEHAGFWFIVAVLVTMILTQGGKVVVKNFWPVAWGKRYRTWSIFVTAFFIGYWSGQKFLKSSDIHELSIFVGVITPIIYHTLEQYAIIKEKILLLSVLKMRSVDRDHDGKISLHETQQFWSGDQ